MYLLKSSRERVGVCIVSDKLKPCAVGKGASLAKARFEGMDKSLLCRMRYRRYRHGIAYCNLDAE
jgi:hypothetical protein